MRFYTARATETTESKKTQEKAISVELLRSVAGRILIEGHQGADAIAPGNSWQAIQAGYAVGADLLDLDVQRIADGALVIHRGYQLPDGRWIRGFDSKELGAQFLEGQQMVFLEEVLDWVKDKPIELSLDTKNDFGFNP